MKTRTRLVLAVAAVVCLAGWTGYAQRPDAPKITITAGSGTRSSASPSRNGFGRTGGESEGGGAPESSSIARER